MISSCFRICLLLFLFSLSAFSQQSAWFYQPEVAFDYSPPNRWSFNFEITNRNLLNDPTAGFTADHLEISHFTSYESGFYSKVSLGIRYRNRDWFDDSRSDEVRVTQQYSYTKPFNDLRLGHRFRFEQRFYEDLTVFRLRYRFGATIPLQGMSLNTGEFYTAVTTETLYSMGKPINPELDQRFTVTLGNQITESIKLQLSGEYRAEDYINGTQNRFFIYSKVAVKL